MTSIASHTSYRGGFLGPLRVLAMIAVLAGAVGSLGLTLYVGHRNPSRILLILFGIWVLSPFALLVFANVVSKPWATATRITFYTVMLVIAVGSLAIYTDVAYGPPKPRPAFAFLMVPLASWLLIAIAAMITRRL